MYTEIKKILKSLKNTQFQPENEENEGKFYRKKNDNE